MCKNYTKVHVLYLPGRYVRITISSVCREGTVAVAHVHVSC